MEKVYLIKSEWDLGLYDTVFSKPQKAHKWLVDNLPLIGLDDTVEELMKDGLIEIREIKVL